jgi:hypothetical protein
LSVHDYAFKMLISDIHEDLKVRKHAFLMTQLLQKYLDYLPAHIPNTYPVTKLQDRLKLHYGNSIVVQIQRGQGKSNLVFSSDVSIGHETMQVTPRSQWGIRRWKCLFSRCHASRFEWQRAIFGHHCKNLQL